VYLKECLSNVRTRGPFWEWNAHIIVVKSFYLLLQRGLTFFHCFNLLPPHLFGMLGSNCSSICHSFQQDDYLIFLDVMVYVENDIFPFKLALQDIQTFLH
jgi:hypothetical protein